MKQIKRLIALVVAVLLICSLSGCRTLDDMRENHAFWGEGGSIMLGDYIYYPLPECDHFEPMLTYDKRNIRVTTPDVPVLLSSMMGSWCSISEDGMLLQTDGIYYCREDYLETVRSRMEDIFVPDEYGYIYYGNNGREIYVLSDTELTAIQTVVAEGDVLELPVGFSKSMNAVLDIEGYSTDKYFRRYAYEINVADDGYYICLPGEEYTKLRRVPEELNAVFTAMLEAYHGKGWEITLES